MRLIKIGRFCVYWHRVYWSLRCGREKSGTLRFGVGPLGFFLWSREASGWLWPKRLRQKGVHPPVHAGVPSGEAERPEGEEAKEQGVIQ